MPSGIDHEPDLSGLSYPERMERHRRALPSIGFQQGHDGVAAYKAKYPEAKRIFTPITAGASLPRPAGYLSAWRRLVGQWLTEEEALARTQGQDVDWLNAELGVSRFDRSRYLSKTITADERKNAAELFEARGLRLPASVQRKGDVKKAAKAGKAKARHGAKPFGSLGIRHGDTLTVGQHTFTVQRLRGGREFIRPRIGGDKRRLYLEDLLATAEWLLGLLQDDAGEATGETPPYYYIIDREWATTPVSAASDPLEDDLAGRSLGEGATPPDDTPEQPNLFERIRRLAAMHQPLPPAWDGTGSDPLDTQP